MWTLPIGQRTMTDIHMHLLPGMDDGAEDLQMALDMVLRAREQGIRTIFATSHSFAFDGASSEPVEVFHWFRKQAQRYFPDMGLYLGCEVYCEAGIMDDVLEALAAGRYPTMNGTEYVLMEFSMWVSPENALLCAEAMAGAGWKPIVAHMERYSFLRGDMELVNRLRDLGCLVQINAYSLFDEQEESIKGWARQLAREQKADFLGTDAHRTYHRPPSAELGLGWLYENCPKEYADRLAFENAARLLTGVT